MSACLLRALLDKLLITDKLKQFGIIDQDCCVPCNEDAETTQHLFFTCSYTSYIWTLCKLQLPQQHGSRHTDAEVIKSRFGARTKTYVLARMVLTAAVWHVWQERNRRTFQKEQM